MYALCFLLLHIIASCSLQNICEPNRYAPYHMNLTQLSLCLSLYIYICCTHIHLRPPNVGLAPIVAKFQSERVTKLITDLSSFFSQALENRLSQINISNNDSKCLGVQFVDLFTLSNEYTDTEEFDIEFPDPLAYCNSRFAVPCEACNVVLGKFGYPLRVNTTSGICNCPVPVISEDDTQLECSQFAFFDELHTTTALNEKLTARILEDLIGEVKVDDLGEN